jgi:hypothetical protein
MGTIAIVTIRKGGKSYKRASSYSAPATKASKKTASCITASPRN